MSSPWRRRASGEPPTAGRPPRSGGRGGGRAGLAGVRRRRRSVIPQSRRHGRGPQRGGAARHPGGCGRPADDRRGVRPLGGLGDRGGRHDDHAAHPALRMVALAGYRRYGGAEPRHRFRKRLPRRPHRPSLLHRHPRNALRPSRAHDRCQPAAHPAHPARRPRRDAWLRLGGIAVRERAGRAGADLDPVVARPRRAWRPGFCCARATGTGSSPLEALRTPRGRWECRWTG